MKASLTRLWQDRTPRERAIVMTGCALLLVAASYAYLWLPISASHRKLMGDLPQLRAQAQQMRVDAVEVERLRAKAKTAAAPGDLKAALTASSTKLGNGAASQVSAESDGRVRVAFAAVRADDWIAWVSGLAIEQRIRIEEARADALETAGAIKASSTFSAVRAP